MARYDWTPFFSAINGAIDDYSERQQYAGLLGGGTNGANQATSGLLSGVDPGQLAMLRRLPPKVGMKMLGEMMKPTEYSTDPKVNAADGKAYVFGKNGSMREVPNYKPREEMKIAPNGQAYNPYALQPGQAFNNPNAAFGIGADGQPVANVPWQNFELARRKAGASNTSIKIDGTPGEDARDRAAGAMVSEFIDSGGYADAEKNLNQLRAVSKTLGSGDNVTGPFVGRVPDAIGAAFNPKAVDTREQVEEVVQRNLRAILGAQFTGNEGERLIARAYNPALPEATNKDRVDRLIGAMEKAYAAKKAAAEYLNKNRTMRGYMGPRIWSLSDIEAAAGLDAKSSPGSNKPSASNW